MVVHADETEKVNTLINHIQAYLYQKKEWNPKWENAFAPALCNRIDRNTGGIVIAAKNAETLRIINEKIKTHELEKSYLCITVGHPRPAEGKIEGFLAQGRGEKGSLLFPSARFPAAKPLSPCTRPWSPGASCLWWSAACSRGEPTRSASPWRKSGCPLLGDGKYGNGACQPAATTRPVRPCIPTSSRFAFSIRRRAF